MISEILKNSIKEAVIEQFPASGSDDLTVILSHPDLESHGDYSTNIALVLAKQVGQNPLVVAERIVAALPAHPAIEKVEAVAPGFINFYLHQHYFLDQLKAVLDAGDQYGRTEQPAGQRVIFEFGQPNTHKIPHIGHLFSYCFGESCSRLLEYTGNTVFRANYQGDVGLHVAKCLWAYQRNSQPDPETLAEKVQYLQECYQQGSAAYEEDEAIKRQIDELNTLIYQKDSTILADWEKTRQWSLDYYRQFEQRIGAHFNQFYLESQTSQVGKQLVLDNVGKVFEEDEGAVIFRGERYGLHTRVFINRLGNPTYEAKDVGLMSLKLVDFPFDRSIYATGNEQNQYMAVLIKAFELLFPETTGKVEHIGYGMINLTTGKMSSRTGNILTAIGLIELVKNRVKEYIVANRDYSAEETEAIAELVAIGAIKYSFLKSAATKNVSFDLESSISFEGNSGPYLQYTYARCQSVLRKAAGFAGTQHQLDTNGLSLNNDELAVLQLLYRFPEVVEGAASERAPHQLCTYLFELAQRYSYFYNEHQIITDDPKTTSFRLAVTRAVAQILANGLSLIGIEVADKI